MRSLPSRHCLFLSTPSARRATRRYIRRRACCRDFYPRPPRGGRQGGCAYELCHLWISIHALREEGDSTAGIMCRRPTNFYPRPPRGGRPYQKIMGVKIMNFYPRPPRGGRRLMPTKRAGRIYFYPRPPRGGRHKTGELALWDDEFLSTPSARRATLCRVYRGIRRDISIHALREEGDLGGVEEPSSSATISIHALREEGDERRLKTQILFTDFYPRPPRGGRRKNLDQWDDLLQFLSTPSARRATDAPRTRQKP